MSLGSVAFKLAFQLSPIVLTGGIAEGIPGGALPIIAITEAASFVDGLLSGTTNIELENFFANFQPLPGTSLIDQDIAHYPFANQAVAANAVIAKPLTISYRMNCSVRLPGGYITKLTTMMALQAALQQHNNSGGTYTCISPSGFFTDCLMVRMIDVSTGQSLQPQTDWQLDFEKPLLTEDQAAQAFNNLMNIINNQTRIDGDPAWSGIGNTIGQPPSLAAPSLIPTASPLAGAGVSGIGGGP